MSKLQHLIEPESLSTKLEEPNILIIDLCNDGLYTQKHIPGAIHLSPKKSSGGFVSYTQQAAFYRANHRDHE